MSRYQEHVLIPDPQLLAHFAQAEEDEKVHGTKNDTRAMVFCSFRDCVLEVVVSLLNLIVLDCSG